jgi:hypothetical protein
MDENIPLSGQIDLDPVEYLWAHWKHHELADFCPKDFAELTVHARDNLGRSRERTTCIVR